jgi:hypothetical protein
MHVARAPPPSTAATSSPRRRPRPAPAEAVFGDATVARIFIISSPLRPSLSLARVCPAFSFPIADFVVHAHALQDLVGDLQLGIERPGWTRPSHGVLVSCADLVSTSRCPPDLAQQARVHVGPARAALRAYSSGRRGPAVGPARRGLLQLARPRLRTGLDRAGLDSAPPSTAFSYVVPQLLDAGPRSVLVQLAWNSFSVSCISLRSRLRQGVVRTRSSMVDHGRVLPCAHQCRRGQRWPPSKTLTSSCSASFLILKWRRAGCLAGQSGHGHSPALVSLARVLFEADRANEIELVVSCSCRPRPTGFAICERIGNPEYAMRRPRRPSRTRMTARGSYASSPQERRRRTVANRTPEHGERVFGPRSEPATGHPSARGCGGLARVAEQRRPDVAITHAAHRSGACRKSFS